MRKWSFGWKLEKRSEQLGCTDGRRTSESGSHPGGAIHSIRNMGDVAFVIIRRREGLFQTVLVNEDVDFSIHDLKEGMTVRVKGVVNKERESASWQRASHS